MLSNNSLASLINSTISKLRGSAALLKDVRNLYFNIFKAQTDLSLSTASLSADKLEHINPSNV